MATVTTNPGMVMATDIPSGPSASGVLTFSVIMVVMAMVLAVIVSALMKIDFKQALIKVGLNLLLAVPVGVAAHFTLMG